MSDDRSKLSTAIPGEGAPADEDSPRPYGRARMVVLILLLALIAVATFVLLGTDQGRAMLDREQLARFAETSRAWARDHVVLVVAAFIFAYCVCAVTLLPVWWLQLLAGFTFGIGFGMALVMTGSTTGALVTAAVSRWLGEEWVRGHILRRGGKWLNRVADLAGRNGLLVVLVSRLSYPVPYGVSNYLFGLLNLSWGKIAFGTAIGGVPVYAGWVAAGARPDWLVRWEFWTIVVAVNLLFLVPLIVHSVRTSKRGPTRLEPAATP